MDRKTETITKSKYRFMEDREWKRGQQQAVDIMVFQDSRFQR